MHKQFGLIRAIRAIRGQKVYFETLFTHSGFVSKLEQMKTLNALLIAASLLPVSALSQQTPEPSSREEALKAIDSFAKSPLSEEGKAAAAPIIKFAEKSKDVTVVVTMKLAPWLARAEKPKFSDTLLVAYVAGNVKSQLERRTKANDSYAGVQQVLKTYAQLKQIDKTLDIPEVQKLVDLEAKKQLKKYVDELLEKEKVEPEK